MNVKQASINDFNKLLPLVLSFETEATQYTNKDVPSNLEEEIKKKST